MNISTLSKESMPGIEWSAIDLEALARAPQYQHVLRMLVTLNDLDSTTYLNDLLNVDTNPDLAPIQQKRIDGARLFLLRQNITAMVNCLKESIALVSDKTKKARMQPQPKKEARLLWHLINDNAQLANLLKEIVELLELKDAVQRNREAELNIQAHNLLKYLRSNQQKDTSNLLSALEGYCSSHEPDFTKDEQSEHTKALIYVRDRIGAHVDVDAVKAGLNHLLTETSDGILWKNPEPKRFRALFIDNVLSGCWMSKGMAIPDAEPQRDVDIADYRDFINKVKNLLGSFIYGLFHAYCTEHKLYLTKDRKARALCKIEKAMDDLL
jgi:hypothetical protein